MTTKVRERRILTDRQVELGYRLVIDDNFTYIYHQERLVAKVTRGVIPRAIREAVRQDSFWRRQALPDNKGKGDLRPRRLDHA